MLLAYYLRFKVSLPIKCKAEESGAFMHSFFFFTLPSVLNLFPCLAGFNLHFLTLAHLQSQPVLPAFLLSWERVRGEHCSALGRVGWG